MTIAEWCLFGAALLPLLTLAPTKAMAPKEFDNANPRDPSFYQEPIRRRALGAHANGFEVFPFFAASVLLAELKHSPQHWLDASRSPFCLFGSPTSEPISPTVRRFARRCGTLRSLATSASSFCRGSGSWGPLAPRSWASVSLLRSGQC